MLKNQAEPPQKVRGIMLAREITTDLSLACPGSPNVELFEYQLFRLIEEKSVDMSLASDKRGPALSGAQVATCVAFVHKKNAENRI